MLHPDQFAEIMATATSTLGGIKPIPTVIPTPTEWQTAGDSGHTALWVVFVLMILASLIFTGLSWNVPVSRRVFHVVTTLITTIAALSYFAMASGHAKSFNCDRAVDHHDQVPDTYHLVCREVFWARYVDWSLTTPLLLLDLCLLAGISGAHTLIAVAADLVMILGGCFAAFGKENTAQKWGWYTIACIAYLVVLLNVAWQGTVKVKAKGNKVIKLFSSLAIFTFILWTAYPIVWGIADGARKTSVDTEIIIYAVLDVLAKGVFGLWLLLSHRSVPETNVELSGYWSHGLTSEGRIRLGDDEDA